MSWPTQRKVRLAVTKFRPESDKPVAGLSPQVREELRARREKETRKSDGCSRCMTDPCICNDEELLEDLFNRQHGEISPDEADVGFDEPERECEAEYPDRLHERIPSWERYR